MPPERTTMSTSQPIARRRNACSRASGPYPITAAWVTRRLLFGSLGIGGSISARESREAHEKKPPLPSGYGGRSEEAVPSARRPAPERNKKDAPERKYEAGY